jgi:hypothetical protein
MIRQFGLLLAVGIVVICLTRSCCRWPPWASASTGRPPRTGLPGGEAGPSGHPPRQPPPTASPRSSPWPAWSSSSAASLVEERARAPDRSRAVGQPGIAVSARTIATLEREVDSVPASSAFVMFVEADEALFTERRRGVRPRLHRRACSTPTPTSCSPRRASSRPSPTSGDPRRHPDLAPTGRARPGGLRAAPPDVQRFTVNPGEGAMNVLFTLRRRTPRRPGGDGQRDPRQRRDRPTASGPPRRGSPWWASALLDNLQSNRIAAHLPGHRPRLRLPALRLRSPVRALLALVPVLIATGAARWWPSRSTSSSAP